jgi:hypothetical protein
VGIHGNMHFKSSVCEHWWELASRTDVILISSAAHVNDILEFPNEKAATPAVNATTIIDASATLLANKLKQLTLKPDAVVVYMTTSAGIENFTNDCDLKPSDTPLPYDSRYHWQMVPYMQQAYVRGFRRVMQERHQPSLVMDLQHIVQMRRGCRGDFVHSSSQVMASPYFNHWLVLYNLMLEYRRGVAN